MVLETCFAAQQWQPSNTESPMVFVYLCTYMVVNHKRTGSNQTACLLVGALSCILYVVFVVCSYMARCLPDMQTVCDSGVCSTDGACSIVSAAPAAASSGSGGASSNSGVAPSAPVVRPNEPPTLALAYANLARVELKQGASYVRCEEEQDPTGSTLCEPGANAADDNDVDIQDKVRYCHWDVLAAGLH